MAIARRLALLLCASLLPASAAAQSRFEFTKALAFVQLYDDNLFYRPSGREEDLISRLCPRIGGGYRTPRLSVGARYTLEAELFQRHPQLNTARARQDAAIDVSYRPTPRLALTASASYSDTQDAAELNLLTGLELERLPARRFQASQSLSRTLGPVTKATVDHSFSRERVTGRPASGSQFAGLTLERRLGAADAGTLGYTLRRFSFDADVATSHVLVLGWSREVTPLVRFEVKAGPRLSGRRVDAEVSAAASRRFRRGDLSLGYVRTQTTVVGAPGAVAAEGVSVGSSRQLLRSLRVSAGPAVLRSRGAGFVATVYRVNFEAAWRLSRHLSLVGSHQLSVQRAGGAGGRDADISHNAFLLSVTAAPAGG